MSGIAHGQAVKDQVDFSALASDPAGISTLSLYIDNKLIRRSPGGQMDYEWDTQKLDDGWVPVALMAQDGAGNRGYAAMAIWVGNGSSVPVGPPPDVEPPVIIDDPNPPQPKPDPDPTPKPPPSPPPAPGPQPILGSGTEEDPYRIALRDQRDPGIPYVLLLGLEIGKEIWGVWHADIICSDDKGVQSLKVYAGQDFLVDSDNGTYSMLLDTRQYPEGLLDISMLIYDGDAHYACDVMVFVTNEKDHIPPTLLINDYGEFDGSLDFAQAGEYLIHAQATDASDIESLTIRVGGEIVAQTSGSGTVEAEYVLDTLHYPGFDPNEAVHAGDYRYKDDPVIGVLVTAIDKSGTAKENTLVLRPANRIIIDSNVESISGADLSGTHVWVEAPPPGGSVPELIETDLSTERYGNFDILEGIPVGDWTMHFELNGEEVSLPVFVRPRFGISMAAEQFVPLKIGLPFGS